MLVVCFLIPCRLNKHPRQLNSGHGLPTSLQIVSVKRRGEHYLESMRGVSERGPGWVWYVEYTNGMGVWMLSS